MNSMINFSILNFFNFASNRLENYVETIFLLFPQNLISSTPADISHLILFLIHLPLHPPPSLLTFHSSFTPPFFLFTLSPTLPNSNLPFIIHLSSTHPYSSSPSLPPFPSNLPFILHPPFSSLFISSNDLFSEGRNIFYKFIIKIIFLIVV